MRRKMRKKRQLQSARSVWRQSGSSRIPAGQSPLQSARSVWRQSLHEIMAAARKAVAICTERVEAKCTITYLSAPYVVAICTERVEAKIHFKGHIYIVTQLQSARSVWRQSQSIKNPRRVILVAICTERVEAKLHVPRSFRFLEVAICTERVEAKRSAASAATADSCCNLHGACGGKDE